MLLCLEAMYLLPACVFLSWRLAEIPVNELVTCISRLVPRYFCLTTVSYRLLAPHPPIPPPPFSFCLCFLLSWLCLFTFTVDGNHRPQEDAARNKAALSLSSAFPFLFFPSLKCSPLGMLWVSKLVCVLGVPGE